MGHLIPSLTTRGPEWFTSSVLPGNVLANGANNRLRSFGFTATADAPAGNIEQANDSWIQIQNALTRPAPNVNGIWVVSEADGVEIAEVFLPWGPDSEGSGAPASNQFELLLRSGTASVQVTIIGKYVFYEAGTTSIWFETKSGVTGTPLTNTRIRIYAAGIFAA